MAFEIHESPPPNKNLDIPPTSDPVDSYELYRARAAYMQAVHDHPGMWVSATLEDVRPGTTDKSPTATRRHLKGLARAINRGHYPFSGQHAYRCVVRDNIIYTRLIPGEEMYNNGPTNP
ncbi:hypothetical protein C1Y63_10490 [Corynebacterium sp. 13CS0277]|uniref:hypothetical protein n=1 Tax=Corynebacterium sp. 13CS0277 TaxID=2071994 RepID=UPI000D029227|nr:hypothetical protein [Corynebacterium sp. 13CS0277]PRQ10614.1 hypothetical protein C1Y63_10490 [Corynebacterium sp. 13CS0277]